MIYFLYMLHQLRTVVIVKKNLLKGKCFGSIDFLFIFPKFSFVALRKNLLLAQHNVFVIKFYQKWNIRVRNLQHFYNSIFNVDYKKKANYYCYSPPASINSYFISSQMDSLKLLLRPLNSVVPFTKIS